MKTWFRLVYPAWNTSPDFSAWCAKHVMALHRDNPNIMPLLGDVADWVEASLRASVPPHVRWAFGETRTQGGEEFITRIFSPCMSLETVLKLSGEWHEAVANNMTGPQCQFPQPWFPAQRIEDYDLFPIENAADLYLEGKTMHHCAGTYAERARRGDCCFFSIRAQGERVATIAFSRGPSGPVIEQIRGHCNAVMPVVEKAIRKWLRRQPANSANLPVIPEYRRTLVDVFDDIPF